MSRRCLSLTLFAIVAGCGPKYAPIEPAGRGEAVQGPEYKFALALVDDDDKLEAHPYRNDSDELRDRRIKDFERLVSVELEALGPLSTANAAAVFGQLVALRQEAARGPAMPIGPTEGSDIDLGIRLANQRAVVFWAARHADLAGADATVLVPRFAETAPVLWSSVDAEVARGNLVGAMVLGATIVAQLPADTPFTARLHAIGAQASATHLAQAHAAGEDQYGARILHARIAEQFGISAGGLSAVPEELVASTTPSWTVTANGPCGDAPREPYLTGAGVPLTTSLPLEGFASGPGQPYSLTVAFDACPVTLREWDTQMNTTYEEDVEVTQIVAMTGYRQGPCSSSVSHSEEYHFGSEGGYTEYTTTTTSGCATEAYTYYEPEQVIITQRNIEQYDVSHRRHHAAATGTIRIAFDTGVTEQRFALEADSNDDLAYSPEHGDSKAFSMLSEPQARARLHAALVAKIYEVRDEALDRRAAPYVARAVASAAAGDAVAAEHDFFVASQITSRPAPAFTQWMQSQYGIPSDILFAAVGNHPIPRLNLAEGHEVVLPELPWKMRVENQKPPMLAHYAWDLRRMLVVTLTAGPTQVAHDGVTNGGFRVSGAYAGAFPVKGPLAIGGGLRYSDGIDVTKTRLIETDAFTGVGVLVGGLSVLATAGFGGDVTPGLAAESPPEAFFIRGGPYVDYGARVAYAIKWAPITVDASYTRVFRSVDVLPGERRGDVRFVLSAKGAPLALTMRYTEYLNEPSSSFAWYGPDERVAQTWWVLGGIGF